MKAASETARLVLDRYKQATAPASADKTRWLDIIQQRGLRGDLPRFDIRTSAPIIPKASLVQKIWASASGKAGLALVVTGLPLFGIYETQRHAGSAAPAPVPVLASAPAPNSPLPSPFSATQPAPFLPGESEPSASSPLPRSSLHGTDSGERTIDAEVKLMTAAQAALRAGDPKRALHLLAEHARRFPNGKLSSARMVAHMVALCSLGKAGEARGEAERFLAKNPSSPFADRVKSVCAAPRVSP